MNTLARHGLLSLALASSAAPARAQDEWVDVGGFVDVEWRVMGLAEHVSHGPAFAAGLTLFDGWLRIGIAGLSRPGPINPATFDTTLGGGLTYRDHQTLSLRSDGAMIGAHVALAFEMPGLEWLAVTLPLTVGYGGAGFYLTGDDRDTPDGDRVSVWEDRLFGGRDSYLGVMVDVGLRLGVVIEDVQWLRPYAAVYYTTVPGYVTVVRDSYQGFSGALGVELGHGL